MLTIIAGKYRGRRIETKENAKIRPTGSRARGAIFNILMHGVFRDSDSSPLIGGRVIDLYCGTGALGLEALSRGAEHVIFVDQSADSMALARANVAHIGVTEQSQFIRSDSTSLPLARSPCTLAFLDPPYRSGLALKSLKSLAAQNWLTVGAVIVVEMEAHEVLEPLEYYELHDDRRYGNARVVFLRYNGKGSE